MDKSEKRRGTREAVEQSAALLLSLPDGSKEAKSEAQNSLEPTKASDAIRLPRDKASRGSQPPLPARATEPGKTTRSRDRGKAGHHPGPIACDLAPNWPTVGAD